MTGSFVFPGLNIDFFTRSFLLARNIYTSYIYIFFSLPFSLVFLPAVFLFRERRLKCRRGLGSLFLSGFVIIVF